VICCSCELGVDSYQHLTRRHCETVCARPQMRCALFFGRPRPILDVAALDSTFTIRAGEWFMEMLSSAVIAVIIKAAPHVRIRFAPKRDMDSRLLRSARTDLCGGQSVMIVPTA
jgi:hypothetical protein